VDSDVLPTPHEEDLSQGRRGTEEDLPRSTHGGTRRRIFPRTTWTNTNRYQSPSKLALPLRSLNNINYKDWN